MTERNSSKTRTSHTHAALLCSPTLTAAGLCPPVLNSDPSGLAGGSIGSQRLAEYVLGPAAQADIQNTAGEEAFGWYVGVAGGKGAP